jgi:hypothetical protein
MLVLGVVLIALGVLGALTLLALTADGRAAHPAAFAAALAGLLVFGSLLLVD